MSFSKILSKYVLLIMIAMSGLWIAYCHAILHLSMLAGNVSGGDEVFF